MMLLMARGLVPRFFLPVMDAKVLQTGYEMMAHVAVGTHPSPLPAAPTADDLKL